MRRPPESAVTCGTGKHLIGNARDMAWEDGLTEGDGYMVPICVEGLCGRLMEDCEEAIRVFRFPGGQPARLMLEKMVDRAKGSEESWIAITARCMVRAFEYFKVVKPRLEAERRAVLEAERMAAVPRAAHVVAGLSYEAYTALQAEKKAERMEETRRRDAAQLAELGIHPSGVDPEFAKIFEELTG